MSKRKTRRKYTQEFKQEAIRLVRTKATPGGKWQPIWAYMPMSLAVG